MGDESCVSLMVGTFLVSYSRIRMTMVHVF